MIDQEQVRNYWAAWVRREIGGNDMVQEAATSAAVAEALRGHDDDFAAQIARNTARSLRAAPFPGPLTSELVTGQLHGPPAPGKPWFREPWFYLAGGAGLVVTVIVVFLVVILKDRVACLDSFDQANRSTDLHNAYIDIYNRDMTAIDACTSLDCERPLKLEIASALKSYNAGLNQMCWPDGKLKTDASALIAANTVAGQAYTFWADATSDTEDSLGSIVDQKDTEQDAADTKLASDLGVTTTSASS